MFPKTKPDFGGWVEVGTVCLLTRGGGVEIRDFSSPNSDLPGPTITP